MDNKTACKPASEFLRKLRVRPGLQMTTHVCYSHPDPYIVVDFIYDRQQSKFAIRLCWPVGRSKVVYLETQDVISSGTSNWLTDLTFKLTEDCIARLSPGLDKAIGSVFERTRK